MERSPFFQGVSLDPAVTGDRHSGRTEFMGDLDAQGFAFGGNAIDILLAVGPEFNGFKTRG